MEKRADVWDRSAGRYDRFVDLTSKDVHVILRELLRSDLGRVGELLEVGTGTGSLSIALADRADRVEACDLSEGMLRVAREKAGVAGAANVHFSRRDIYALGFDEGRFDAVVACNVLHLLDEPEKAVDALRRVAKKGGLIVLPTFVLGENLISGLIFRWAVRCFGVRVPNRWSRGSYLAFLRACGLSIEKDALVGGKIPLCYAVARK